MPSQTHPLIQAVVKPLKNAEQQLAATNLLEQTLDPTHPHTEKTLKRLEKTTPRKLPVLLLFLAVTIALMITASIQKEDLRLFPRWMDSDFFPIPEAPVLPKKLTEQQSLLLGNPALSELQRKEQLYQSTPENPAYYLEYLIAYQNEYEEFPPDFYETIARIAPRNSFFLYYAAASAIDFETISKKSVRSTAAPRIVHGKTLRPLPTESELSVIDQAAFDKAMALIEQASSLTELEDYSTQMAAIRSGLFSPNSFMESLNALMHVYMTPSPLISLRKVADLLNTQAQLLSHAGDKERFLALVEQQKHFVRVLGENPDISLVGELVYTVIASSNAQYFHWAAERLELTELSEEYRKQMDAFQTFRDRRELPTPQIDRQNQLNQERGSILANMSISMIMKQVENPPPLTAEDWKPLRMVEHQLASRFGMLAAMILLIFSCLIVYLFRFHSPRPTRIPALQLSRLLTLKDWVWIVSLGIAAPILIFLSINRLTPLGGQAYSLSHFLYALPLIHLLAILLSLLLAPAILIRWRLSLWLAPYGINSRPDLISLALLLLILLWSLAAYPVLQIIPISRYLLMTLAAVPGLTLCYIFFNALLSFVGKPLTRIPRVATSAALLPSYAVAIIALCLTIPIFQASEGHWIKQDRILKLDPDAENLGAYEFKVAEERRREVNAILGF